MALHMDMTVFNKLCASLALDAKALFLAALRGFIPDGYRVEDALEQPGREAVLRMVPEVPEAGKVVLTFMHQLSHRELHVDSLVRIIPSREMVSVAIQVYVSPTELGGPVPDGFGKDGVIEAVVFHADMAASIRFAVSEAMSHPPFTRFEWRRCEHDPKGTLELCNHGAKVSKIWKSGGSWGTLTGDSRKTKEAAMRLAESAVRGSISTAHQERLAGLCRSDAALLLSLSQ